jgi:hypothetical protein
MPNGNPVRGERRDRPSGKKIKIKKKKILSLSHFSLKNIEFAVKLKIDGCIGMMI